MSFSNTTRRVPGKEGVYVAPDGRELVARSVGKNLFPASPYISVEPVVILEETGTHSSAEKARMRVESQYSGFGRNML